MPTKCPLARKQHNLTYYKKHKSKIIDRNNAKIQRNRDAVSAIKAKISCLDCNTKFHPVAMDFDHVKGEKLMNVAEMVVHGFSLESIMAEIAKCELVCSNCHRVRTFLRGQNSSILS